MYEVRESHRNHKCRNYSICLDTAAATTAASWSCAAACTSHQPLKRELERSMLSAPPAATCFGTPWPGCGELIGRPMRSGGNADGGDDTRENTNTGGEGAIWLQALG